MGASRRRPVAIVAALLAALGAAACGEEAPAAPGERAAWPPTIVVLPDTQYYAASHPSIFEATTRWIADRAAARNLALVLHAGDIVDASEPRQWEVAADCLHALDGVVPYVLVPGNHDYTYVGRETLLDEYFPLADLEDTPWFGGSFEEDSAANTFHLVPVGDETWLVVGLEYAPRDPVLEWADAVLSRFTELPAILLTHAYLHHDGTRYNCRRRPDQRWCPGTDWPAALPGGASDGERLWRALVEPHENVRLVISGHALGDGVDHLSSLRRGGGQVHQLLANYQMRPLGGGGYLRLMAILPDRIEVTTYSPYLGRSLTDPGNQLTLPR